MNYSTVEYQNDDKTTIHIMKVYCILSYLKILFIRGT